MLPKANRLKRDKDFKALFSKKTPGVFGVFCGAKWKKNDLKVSRAAVVVGTKISKIAVVRNRLRRQIREVLRLNLDKLKPGYDLVLIVNKKALNKEYSELEQDVLKLLKKTPLL